jgi:hypothetical protein
VLLLMVKLLVAAVQLLLLVQQPGAAAGSWSQLLPSRWDTWIESGSASQMSSSSSVVAMTS